MEKIKVAYAGSGCSKVDRVVASDNIDPQFESYHWQILFTINRIKNYIERRKRGLFRPNLKQEVLVATRFGL